MVFGLSGFQPGRICSAIYLFSKPANSKLERPMTTGLMALSHRLLSNGRAPYQGSSRVLNTTSAYRQRSYPAQSFFSKHPFAVPTTTTVCRRLVESNAVATGGSFCQVMPDRLLRPFHPGDLSNRHPRTRIFEGCMPANAANGLL